MLTKGKIKFTKVMLYSGKVMEEGRSEMGASQILYIFMLPPPNNLVFYFVILSSFEPVIIGHTYVARRCKAHTTKSDWLFYMVHERWK